MEVVQGCRFHLSLSFPPSLPPSFSLSPFLPQTRMMALVPNPEANYRNLFQAFSKIIRTEHARVLFRGIGVVASGAGPAHALYFSCYEFSKKALTRANTQSTVLAQGERSPSPVVHASLYCSGYIVLLACCYSLHSLVPRPSTVPLLCVCALFNGRVEGLGTRLLFAWH